jgi:hypothetical protein
VSKRRCSGEDRRPTTHCLSRRQNVHCEIHQRHIKVGLKNSPPILDVRGALLRVPFRTLVERTRDQDELTELVDIDDSTWTIGKDRPLHADPLTPTFISAEDAPNSPTGKAIVVYLRKIADMNWWAGVAKVCALCACAAGPQCLTPARTPHASSERAKDRHSQDSSRKLQVV